MLFASLDMPYHEPMTFCLSTMSVRRKLVGNGAESVPIQIQIQMDRLGEG